MQYENPRRLEREIRGQLIKLLPSLLGAAGTLIARLVFACAPLPSIQLTPLLPRNACTLLENVLLKQRSDFEFFLILTRGACSSSAAQPRASLPVGRVASPYIL